MLCARTWSARRTCSSPDTRSCASSQDFELRKIVRGAGGKYRVIKNNIADKASEGTPAGAGAERLRGMTSLAYTEGDPVALAKALTAYAKANPSFTFKAGIVEGRVIDVKAINDLADDAVEGRDLRQTAVPDQCSGTAAGYDHERRRTQSGGGGRSGREGKQVSSVERASAGSVHTDFQF